MDVLNLVAKLTLDSSGYDEGLENAESKGGKFGAGMAKAAKGVGIAVAAVTTATVAAGGAFVKGAGQVAEYGDHVDKMSQKLGISAEAYQEWDAILQHSGASIDSMKGAMKTLARQAQSGAEEFKQLGISEQEVASLSQEELFSRVITGLQNMEEGTKRTALATKLLGRGGTELGALLNTSAEDTEKMRQRVHELGGVMSDEAVKAAARYQDSLQDMQTALDGTKRNIMSSFLPSLADVMDGLGNLFSGDSKTGLGQIREGISGFIENMTKAVPRVIEVAGTIVRALGEAIIENLPRLLKTGIQVVLAIIKGLAKAAPKLIPAIVKAILEMVDTMIDNIDLMVDAAIELGLGIAEGLIKATPLIVKKLPEIIVKIVAALLKNLPKFVSAGGELIKSLANGMYAAFTSIPSNIASRASKIGDSIRQGASNLYNIGKERILDLWHGIRDIFVQIPDLVRNYASSIPSKIKQGVGSLYNTGWNLIAGFWNGIRDKFDDTIDRVKSLARKLPKAVKKVLGIASPSKVFAEIGQWIPEGLAEGIENNIDSVRAATNAMVDGAAFGADGFEVEIDEGRGYSAGMNNTFNIYAQPGQDVQELAREVEKVLVRLQNQRKAAFA